MGTWLLKYLIVFNVIRLEYLMSDTKGASFQLSRQDGFEIARFKRYSRILRQRRMVKNAAKESLDEQLSRKAQKQETESNPCLAAPCSHGGVCTWRQDKDPPFKCKCPLGYKGRWCDESIPECDSQPCTEKGSCVATPNGFVCICKEGFDGIYCEDKNKKNETVFVITPEEIYEGEIALGIFGGLVVVIVIILIIHFRRVNKRREEMKAQYHILLAKDDTPPPLPPGLFEVSSLLCKDFFCFLCPKRSESLTKYEKSLSKLELKKAYHEVLEQGTTVLDEEEPLINGHILPEQTLSMDSFLPEHTLSTDSVWRNTFDKQNFRKNISKNDTQSEILQRQYYDSSIQTKQYCSEPIYSNIPNRDLLNPEYSWVHREDKLSELSEGAHNEYIEATFQHNRNDSNIEAPLRRYSSTPGRGIDIHHNRNLSFTEKTPMRYSLSPERGTNTQHNRNLSYTETMPIRYSSTPERGINAQLSRNRSYIEPAPRRYSSTRRNEDTLEPVQMKSPYQPKVADELNEEIVNVQHLPSPERKESSHSSRVLPRVRSKRLPSSKKSLNQISSSRKWGYNVDPRDLVFRRKSLHESTTSQEDIDDLYDRRNIKHSRPSLTKRFSKLKHSTSKVGDPQSSRHDEINVFTGLRGNIPPAPPLPPVPFD